MIPTGTCPQCGAPFAPGAAAQPVRRRAFAATSALPPPGSLPPPTFNPPPQPAPVYAGPPPQPQRNTGTMVTAALIAVIAIVGMVLVFTSKDKSGGTTSDGPGTGPTVTYDVDIDPAALSLGQVLLEPVNQPTVDAFTDDSRLGPEVQPTVTLPDLPTSTVATTAPEQVTQPPQVTGSQPGLYGGTRNNQVCDKEKMITYLEQHTEMGAAWAQVQGIAVTDLRAYISALTPVILTRDTLVQNHGFKNGQPYAHPSVLQAGSAVLVDPWGVPRAKCSCGNPLLPPPVINVPPEFVGPQWPGFEPTVIIVVVAPPTPIVGGITIVDLTTGELIVRPLGADENTQDLATGDVRVTLTWGDTADLDLAVTDPNGETIYYDVKASSSGGQLDVDANGGCQSAITSPAENIIWPDTGPSGQYVVQVSIYDDCGAGAAHPFVLQVLIGGVPVALSMGGDDGVLTPTDGVGTLTVEDGAMVFVFTKG